MTTRLTGLPRRLLQISLLLCLTALWLPGASLAGEMAVTPRVVKIHADWCGTCVKLNPTWEALEKEYGDSVDFIIFDMTDVASKSKAQTLADELELAPILAKYGGGTGQIVILPAGSSEPTAVLKGQMDPGVYAGPIAQARKP